MDSPTDTTLHHAVLCMDLVKIKQLVNNEVDINIRDHHTQNTPLHFFNFTYPPEIQCEVLRFFLDHKASLATSGVKGPTVGGNFFRFGKLELLKVLLEYEIDWSAKGNDGRTLLHHAASNENPGIIELFEDRNFEVNASDDNGFTPIWCAAEIANFDAVKFLIKNGADVTSVGRYGFTSFLWGFFECCQNTKSWEDWLKCAELFLSHGADCELVVDNNHNFISWTVFDQVLSEDSFMLIEPVLAHLAKLQALGKPIKELTLTKISFFEEFQNYFDLCKRTIEEMRSTMIDQITLFDLLVGNDQQIVSLTQNKDFREQLQKFILCDHLTYSYDVKILRQRFEKALKAINV